MNSKRVVHVSAWLVGITMAFALGTALGQQSPPAENKGLNVMQTIPNDLGPQFAGYQLRFRKLTFEPGGVAGIHSHAERPAFAYILEGTLTEGRAGGYTKEYKPGDVIVETRDVTHWAENKGKTPVVLVGVDVVKP